MATGRLLTDGGMRSKVDLSLNDMVQFAVDVSTSEGTEELDQLVREKLGFLERREVSSSWHFCPSLHV
jgi:hypothetical protein